MLIFFPVQSDPALSSSKLSINDLLKVSEYIYAYYPEDVVKSKTSEEGTTGTTVDPE